MSSLRLEALEDRSLPAPLAPLDPTFATGGTLAGPFVVGNDQILVTREALQSDGKIVLAGKLKNTGADVGVVRLDTNGNLDPGFGSAGVVRIPQLASSFDLSTVGLDLDSQERIIVGGETTPRGSVVPAFFTAVRLTTSGQVDTAFGTAGTASVQVNSTSAVAGVRVAVTPGNQVVLAGAVTDATVHTATVYLARFTASGTLDATFGTNGIATISYGSGTSFLLSSGSAGAADNLFALPDGRLLLAGPAEVASSSVAVVTRLTSSGALDTDYAGGKGFTTLPFSLDTAASATPAGALPDGSLLLGGKLVLPDGSTAANPLLERLTPSGTLDSSFGTLGVQQLPLPIPGGLPTPIPFGLFYTPRVDRVGVQADGRIVVLYESQTISARVGAVTNSTEYVLRLQSRGAPDSSFAATGPLRIEIGQATDLTLQPDGRYVVVGHGSGASLEDIPSPPYAVFRLQGAAAPPVFHAITPISFDPATALWYVRQSNPDGTTQVVSFPFGLPGWKPVVGDWDGSGSKGIGVFDPTTATWYLLPAFSTKVIQFVYGAPGWTPVVGDWNAAGTDTVGVVDPSTMTWYLRNSNSAGAPDYTPFQYGIAGWIPVVGDWTGVGHAGVGVFDPSTATWYLRTETSGGTADAGSFQYGAAGWSPVVGDWSLSFTDTVGVVDPTGHWYLRKSNNSGVPDAGSFPYGLGNWTPLSGAY